MNPGHSERIVLSTKGGEHQVTLPVQTRVQGSEVRPFFFGPREELFGCYHTPAAGDARSCAIVLCNPLGFEYFRSHRSFVQLARRLARVGFPVLRFDYFGSGDSAGRVEEGHIDRWLADIEAASAELRRRSGARQTSFAGLRLGGTLASLAAERRVEVESLVLWDPVIQGRAHADELEALQSDLLRLGYLTPPERGVPNGRPPEVLGMPMSPEQWAELEAIDLAAIQRAPAGRVLLVESAAPVGLESLRARWQQLGATVEHQHLAEPRVWLAEPLKGMVAHALLDAVVSWLARVHR